MRRNATLMNGLMLPLEYVTKCDHEQVIKDS